MASLMEELLDVLHQEKESYDELLSLTDGKRDSIVNKDLDKLTSITNQEEEISSRLKNLENKTARILTDMSVVLGLDGDRATVGQVIEKLANQPEEQIRLTEARDSLVESATKMQFMNQQNQILLQQALEMVEFDLTLFKSLRQAPETANYDKNAYNTGDLLGSGSFDFKQ